MMGLCFLLFHIWKFIVEMILRLISWNAHFKKCPMLAKRIYWQISGLDGILDVFILSSGTQIRVRHFVEITFEALQVKNYSSYFYLHQFITIRKCSLVFTSVLTANPSEKQYLYVVFDDFMSSPKVHLINPEIIEYSPTWESIRYFILCHAKSKSSLDLSRIYYRFSLLGIKISY